MFTVSNDIIDILTASIIPDEMSWADTISDDFSVATTIEREGSVCSSQEWETVGQQKMEREFVRTPKWCKHGNACLWQNCPFRHERCEHYDNWLASHGRTRGCRCQTTDPRSCKSPEQGGCKYDHRDLSKLDIYYSSLPCKTEAELWNSFYERGLDTHASNAYDVTEMSRVDRALLVRSLIANGVEFEDYTTWMQIYAEW